MTWGVRLNRVRAHLLLSGQMRCMPALSIPPKEAVGQRVTIMAEGDGVLFLAVEKGYLFEPAKGGGALGAYGYWVKKKGKKHGTLQWAKLPRGMCGSAELVGWVEVDQKKQIVGQYRPGSTTKFRGFKEARFPLGWVFRAPRVTSVEPDQLMVMT